MTDSLDLREGNGDEDTTLGLDSAGPPPSFPENDPPASADAEGGELVIGEEFVVDLDGTEGAEAEENVTPPSPPVLHPTAAFNMAEQNALQQLTKVLGNVVAHLTPEDYQRPELKFYFDWDTRFTDRLRQISDASIPYSASEGRDWLHWFQSEWRKNPIVSTSDGTLVMGLPASIQDKSRFVVTSLPKTLKSDLDAIYEEASKTIGEEAKRQEKWEAAVYRNANRFGEKVIEEILKVQAIESSRWQAARYDGIILNWFDAVEEFRQEAGAKSKNLSMDELAAFGEQLSSLRQRIEERFNELADANDSAEGNTAYQSDIDLALLDNHDELSKWFSDISAKISNGDGSDAAANALAASIRNALKENHNELTKRNAANEKYTDEILAKIMDILPAAELYQAVTVRSLSGWHEFLRHQDEVAAPIRDRFKEFFDEVAELEAVPKSEIQQKWLEEYRQIYLNLSFPYQFAFAYRRTGAVDILHSIEWQLNEAIHELAAEPNDSEFLEAMFSATRDFLSSQNELGIVASSTEELVRLIGIESYDPLPDEYMENVHSKIAQSYPIPNDFLFERDILRATLVEDKSTVIRLLPAPKLDTAEAVVIEKVAPMPSINVLDSGTEVIALSGPPVDAAAAPIQAASPSSPIGRILRNARSNGTAVNPDGSLGAADGLSIPARGQSRSALPADLTPADVADDVAAESAAEHIDTAKLRAHEIEQTTLRNLVAGIDEALSGAWPAENDSTITEEYKHYLRGQNRIAQSFLTLVVADRTATEIHQYLSDIHNSFDSEQKKLKSILEATANEDMTQWRAAGYCAWRNEKLMKITGQDLNELRTLAGSTPKRKSAILATGAAAVRKLSGIWNAAASRLTSRAEPETTGETSVDIHADNNAVEPIVVDADVAPAVDPIAQQAHEIERNTLQNLVTRIDEVLSNTYFAGANTPVIDNYRAELLLVKKGAERNSSSNAETASGISLVSSWRTFNTIQRLLEIKKNDLNSRTIDDKTAIEWQAIVFCQPVNEEFLHIIEKSFDELRTLADQNPETKICSLTEFDKARAQAMSAPQAAAASTDPSAAVDPNAAAAVTPVEDHGNATGQTRTNKDSVGLNDWVRVPANVGGLVGLGASAIRHYAGEKKKTLAANANNRWQAAHETAANVLENTKIGVSAIGFSPFTGRPEREKTRPVSNSNRNFRAAATTVCKKINGYIRTHKTELVIGAAGGGAGFGLKLAFACAASSLCLPGAVVVGGTLAISAAVGAATRTAMDYARHRKALKTYRDEVKEAKLLGTYAHVGDKPVWGWRQALKASAAGAVMGTIGFGIGYGIGALFHGLTGGFSVFGGDHAAVPTHADTPAPQPTAPDATHTTPPPATKSVNLVRGGWADLSHHATAPTPDTSSVTPPPVPTPTPAPATDMQGLLNGLHAEFPGLVDQANAAIGKNDWHHAAARIGDMVQNLNNHGLHEAAANLNHAGVEMIKAHPESPIRHIEKILLNNEKMFTHAPR